MSVRTFVQQGRQITSRCRRKAAPRMRLLVGLFAAGVLAFCIDVLAFGTYRNEASQSTLPAARESSPVGSDDQEGLTTGMSQGSAGDALSTQQLPADTEEIGGLPAQSTETNISADECTTAVQNMLEALETRGPLDAATQVELATDAFVPDAACALLDVYHKSFPCVLAQEGYLDLSGNVWACVVQGEGWIDLGIVSAQEAGSKVRVVRLCVDAWADLVSEEGWDQALAEYDLEALLTEEGEVEGSEHSAS